MPAICADHRGGFTMIELLTVIAIIAVLAGITMAVYGPLQEAQRASRTKQILLTVVNALRLGQTERGSLPLPAEHPFAGSKQPRLRFRGKRNGAWIDVDPAGEALAGVDESRIQASERGRLLLADDRCNEVDLPGVYGMPRAALGILGAPQAETTRCLDLRAFPGTGPISPPYLPFDDRISSGAVPYSTIDPPYPDMTGGNTFLPRDRYLREGIATKMQQVVYAGGGSGGKPEYRRQLAGAAETEASLNAYLQAGVLDELRALGALRVPDAGAEGLVAGPGTPAGYRGSQPVTAQGSSSRVRADGPALDAWRPGCIRPTLSGSGPWRRYRLPALALYDAWGTEILYQLDGNRSAVLVSAGRDRCFLIRPGLADANGASIFATSLAAGYDGVPAAPDEDASIDNIRLDTGSR